MRTFRLTQKNQTNTYMKNSIKALVVLALVVFAGTTFAQNSADATATANASIICPIGIKDANTNGNLEFGKITNSASNGTLVIAADATTNTGVYTNCSQSPGSVATHAAHYETSGQAGAAYKITPGLVSDFSPAGPTLTGLTSSLGTQTNFPNNEGGCTKENDLYIGGTINLHPADNGTYTATITVNVQYD
jgi:hypothetical protein